MKKIVLLASLLTLLALTPAHAQTRAVAIFAGGCFWCMEPPFDRIDGVLATTSGYTGGTRLDPTYEQVTAGGARRHEGAPGRGDPPRGGDGGGSGGGGGGGGAAPGTTRRFRSSTTRRG